MNGRQQLARAAHPATPAHSHPGWGQFAVSSQGSTPARSCTPIMHWGPPHATLGQQRALVGLQASVLTCVLPTCAAVPLLLRPSPPTQSPEEGDLASLATAALESGQAMSTEEQMLMQASGAYGAGAMVGGYGNSAGGILDTPAPVTTPAESTGLEAGNQDSASTAAKPAAPAAPAAAKSAASPAAKSTGLVFAGVMVALSAFLL